MILEAFIAMSDPAAEAASTISGLGGTGIAAFAVYQLAKFVTLSGKFLERLEDRFAEQAQHERKTEEHQARLELAMSASRAAPARLPLVRVPNPARPAV
jgi:hypothetical protein